MNPLTAMNNPWLKLSVVLFMWFSPNFQLSFGADTISANQSLSGNQTIVSPGGHFVLGFFSPGNSSNYYIAIWYGNVSELTPVWVANRGTPVRDIYSSELKISGGNLVLFNESRVPIWSTDISSNSSSSAVAVLEDNGNLVFRDDPNSSAPLWQSFDHPSYTWLPGSKFGLNKRTNQSQILTSWKSSEDPAPDLYSLELDPTGTNQFIVLFNWTEYHWTSGPWGDQTVFFSSVPRVGYYMNFSFVSNESESYFTYSLNYPDSISRIIIDVSGQIKQLSWSESNKQWILYWSQPRQECDVYDLCGAFSSCNEGLSLCNCLRGFHLKSGTNWDPNVFSEGCTRTTKLQCDEDPSLATGKSDKFLKSSNVKISQDAQSMSVRSKSECETSCLGNCYCTAYAVENNRCSIWMGDLFNLQQLGEDDTTGRTMYIKLAASEIPSESSPTKKRLIVVGIPVSAGLLFLGLMMFILMKGRRRTIIHSEPAEASLVAFRDRDLEKATKNFSEKLGKGGFGSVFKGTLPDGSIIAVKKLESINQGEKQFRAEINTVGSWLGSKDIQRIIPKP